MINVLCYNCGSSQHEFYASENGFNLVKCSQCGLLYVNPRPSDEEIQESTKLGVHRGQHTVESTGRFMSEKLASYSTILQDIYHTELIDKKRTWLDVGCGHGELMMALDRFSQGHVVAKGLEPNLHKVKAASGRGLDVSYFDLSAHNQQYDVVSILNVYSHLTSPPEFLLLLKRCMKVGGELLLETGDTANLLAREHDRPFLLPDHLSFTSEEVMRGLLEKSGFDVLSVHKYPALNLQFMKTRVLKELVKVVLPNRRSQIWTLYSQYRLSKKCKTDMYVRARLRR